MTERTSSPLSLIIAVALGVLTISTAADAQGWYYVNNQPASPEIAAAMAARGLPFGYYWLNANGNWGMAGGSDVRSNIYGRGPSLSERGLLYSPGELLR